MTDGLVNATREDENSVFIVTSCVNDRKTLPIILQSPSITPRHSRRSGNPEPWPCAKTVTTIMTRLVDRPAFHPDHSCRLDQVGWQKWLWIPAAARMTDGLVNATHEDENSVFIVTSCVNNRKTLPIILQSPSIAPHHSRRSGNPEPWPCAKTVMTIMTRLVDRPTFNPDHSCRLDQVGWQKGLWIPAAAKMTDGLVKATHEDENSVFIVIQSPSPRHPRLGGDPEPWLSSDVVGERGASPAAVHPPRRRRHDGVGGWEGLWIPAAARMTGRLGSHCGESGRDLKTIERPCLLSHE